jgi:hypothetical protein
MIVGLLKHNRSFSIVALPLLMVALWLHGFMHPATPMFQSSSPLYEWIVSGMVHYPMVIRIVSFLLVLSQALFINYILNENEVLHTNSYFPAGMYMILMSLQPEMHWLHPIIIANLFMLLALHKLLQTYRQDTAYAHAFDVGFYIALASLFYLPSLVFIVLLWAGLVVLRPFIWREWIISLMGVLVPWILIAVCYFCFSSMDVFIKKTTPPFSAAINTLLLNSWFSGYEIFQIIVLGIVSIFSLGYVINSPQKHNLRTRSNTILLTFFFALSAVSIFFAPVFSISNLSFMAIPFTFFFSNYLLLAKRKWIAELLFTLLIISIFLNQYIN